MTRPIDGADGPDRSGVGAEPEPGAALTGFIPEPDRLRLDRQIAPQRSREMDNWLASLITETPTEGYDLAVKMSRVAVKLTQPDAAMRDKLRPEYAEDAEALIAVSHVVATNFATVAAANGYWRK